MRKIALFTASIFVLVCSSAAFAGPAPQNILELANSQLALLGSDATVVKAVKAANAEGRTLAQIEALDAQWRADKKAGNTPAYMAELMANDCSGHLKSLMAKHSFITEIFVTDNQGANVAQTGGTGDFWQGDEAKFKEVFNKGILVSDVEQEDGKNISQVSIPVLDGSTHIGTMTIGVDVDRVPK